MATLTLLPDTGHHHQQQPGHHHAKKKCTSATCCSPSRIWRSIQELIADNNKQDLIQLCQDPNKASHVLRGILTSRLPNDASLYPASNKHRVLQLVDDGTSGLSPLHYRATVNAMFGKTATDLNALQLALFHRNEGIACYILQSVRQYATDKEAKLFVNHLWGTSNGSLHLACFLGMPRVVQLLLDMGVAPDALNGKRKTALDCCVDLNTDGSGGRPSVLDCRTLIEQALLIKQGKKMSVDASSPSPSQGVSVTLAAPEQKPGDTTVATATATTFTTVDGEFNNDECMVNGDMTDEAHDELSVVDPITMDNDNVKSDLEDAVPFTPDQVPARVSILSSGKNGGHQLGAQDEEWCLPILLLDNPFDSGDAFASDDNNDSDQDEVWTPPLLIMDSPFALDPFVSDDDDGIDQDELWSPPLLIMDSPFALDPFASEDDDDGKQDDERTPPLLIMDRLSAPDDGLWTLPMLLLDAPFDYGDPFASEGDGIDDAAFSMDNGDGLKPGVLALPRRTGVCSASDGGGGLNRVSFLNDSYSDGNSSGGTLGSSSFADSGGRGKASVSPPTLNDGGTSDGHSPLLLGTHRDPISHGNHQAAHSDPRVAACLLRSRKRHLDPNKTEHDMDTWWSQQYRHGTMDDIRNLPLLYSFVKQFKIDLKLIDWKALQHEPDSIDWKNHDFDPTNVLALVNDGVGDQDNPNIERLLSMIARVWPPPPSLSLLNQCNFDYHRTALKSHGLNYDPSLMAMVGGDT